jgi:hypothetical protein
MQEVERWIWFVFAVSLSDEITLLIGYFRRCTRLVASPSVAFVLHFDQSFSFILAFRGIDHWPNGEP